MRIITIGLIVGVILSSDPAVPTSIGNSSHMIRSIRFVLNSCLVLCIGSSFAQLPSSVDIDLVQGPSLDSLAVRVRANGQAFDGLVSGLTFTIRWPSVSVATMGALTTACQDAIPISPTATAESGAFNYKTYNAFGLSPIFEGCPTLAWPANQWVVIMKVKVLGVTPCTEFNIVNDAWTNANNRDFYIGLNGSGRTGLTGTVPVVLGSCLIDCLGVVGGSALPGSACNDNEVCTLNDVWGATCACAGTVLDSDGDGACDANDGCPNDPFKIAPGVCGCGTVDSDTDGDGTLDCQDACANDPLKVEPGICGCGTADTDSDSDGTPDCNDGCPTDPAKNTPGNCGCGNVEPGTSCDDGDIQTINDQVQGDCSCAGNLVDCNDDDPCTLDTYNGVQCVNAELPDTDGDGACDLVDQCPNDPLKTVPGQCGCGTLDTDTDNDGIADCNDDCPLNVGQINSPCDDGNAQTNNDVILADCTCAGSVIDCDDGDPCTVDSFDGSQCVNLPGPDVDGDGICDLLDECPNDALKIAPGQCGCGIADVDTDADVIADCNDGCPSDPLKVEPGQCGCGQLETDTDGDLSADCVDGCPSDPLKTEPGPCGCGVVETDTDGDTIPDCIDGCPLLSGQAGSPCDDGDPSTVSDVLDLDCSCSGVPVNDECVTPITLIMQAPADCPTNATAGDNSTATSAGANPECDPTGTTLDVWYAFNSGTHEVVSIALTPGSMTSWGIAVYQVCNGSEPYCVSMPAGPFDLPVQSGTDYLIRVYSVQQFGQPGTFSICVSYSVGQGVQDPSNSGWIVYPNPSEGILNILNDGRSGIAELDLMDLAGRVILRERVVLLQGGVFQFSCNRISRGSYLLRIRSDGQQHEERVVLR